MHLLVAAPPAFLYHNWAVTTNGKTEYYGLVFDILNSLAEAFNFTYEVHLAQSYGTARKGLTGMVYHKEVNLSIGAISPTYERRQFTDFLTPYRDIDTTFTTYQEPPEPDIFLSFRPLTFNSTLTLAMTWIMCSLVLSLIVVKNSPNTCKWKLVLDILFDILGAGVKQGAVTVNKSSSTRVRTIFACWSFVSLITTTIYVSLLVALAAVPPKAATIDSFAQLAALPDYEVMIYDGSSVREAFQESKRGAMADIWKNKIKPNPENMVLFSETQASILKRLSSNKLAFVTDMEELKSLTAADCNLHIAKDRAYGASLAFPVTKGAPYKKQFDEHIMALVESGIISKWVNAYEKQFFKSNCMKEEQTASPIEIANIVAPLIVLSVGSALCMCVLVLELSMAYYYTQKQNKFHNAMSNILKHNYSLPTPFKRNIMPKAFNHNSFMSKSAPSR